MNLSRISARVTSPVLARVAAFFVATTEAQVGRAVKEFIYSKIGEYPQGSNSDVGKKILRVVQNQADAEDLIQDQLRYLVESGYELRAESGDAALNEIIGYVRTRSHSLHSKNVKKQRREIPEEHVPEEVMEKAEEFDPKLEEKADIADFLEEFDELLPDLLSTLSPAEKALFDIIFNEGVGTFSQDIKQNMSQGSALRDKYPDLHKKNEKRWSGFVYDTRKKLFDKIQDFLFGDTSKQFRERMRSVA